LGNLKLPYDTSEETGISHSSKWQDYGPMQLFAENHPHQTPANKPLENKGFREIYRISSNSKNSTDESQQYDCATG
jgi:hypothetical protein